VKLGNRKQFERVNRIPYSTLIVDVDVNVDVIDVRSTDFVHDHVHVNGRRRHGRAFGSPPP